MSDTLKVEPLVLGIGVILATFQASGNVDVAIQEYWYSAGDEMNEPG